MFAMLNDDLETAMVKVVVAGPFAAGKTALSQRCLKYTS